ncbi:AMP-binding protein [Streptomyces sp. ISL-86]|uniref:AMP-binding protein n=1 Tax=Streptomyces sp. ISL-86 TaxID=2819187 RepID=UPI001BEC4B06|nr:AMP-binding protein [Streptomyces sp. ISL-86]MBT2453669.1 AMP-binding protein [Streptomyces sp. ISL-86]
MTPSGARDDVPPGSPVGTPDRAPDGPVPWPDLPFPAGPADTVRERVRRHARERPEAVAVTVLRGGLTTERLNYRQLDALAGRAGAALRAAGARTGDRVVLVLPNDESFPAALVAAVGVGLVSVPAPAPEADRADAVRERLLSIIADCCPALVVTLTRWAEELRALLGPSGPRCLAWEELAGGASDDPAGSPVPDARTEFAFLQYTSGSTGRPKGVSVTHEAVLASCAQAARVYGEHPEDVAVTWVPLHHDMGLVTGVLRPLFGGYGSVLLTPREFVRSPGSWLAAVTAHRGTLSSAPDFGYELCLRRIPEEELRGFDLSSWRVARNAGEVVRAATAERFAARFAPTGLRPGTLCPSYGMAEATLTVTSCTPEVPPVTLLLDQELYTRGTVAPARPGAAAVRLLSSGVPVPGAQVRVRSADPGRVGEVFVRGPQLFTGYWPRRRAPGWHRTGDLGFLYRGHLFVVGRADDVLVHQGRNFHPADLQAVCAEVPGLRAGRCAAFVVPHTTADRICLVAEVGGTAGPGLNTAVEVRRRLARSLGLYVSEVVLLPAGGLPVTTSGKVRTAETARRYRLGLLPVAR